MAKQELRIQQGIHLNEHSRMGAGGPADYFTIAETSNDLIEAALWARDKGIAFRVIGAGANTIFTDEGFRGLIIVNQTSGLGQPERLEEGLDVQKEKEKHHLITTSWCMEFDTPEPPADYSLWVESGVILEDLISWTLERRLAGLEYYTGIPSTIGGALYSNVHFANHLIGPRVLSAEALDENLEERTLDKTDMDLGYDQSVFRRRPYVLLRTKLALSSADEKTAVEAIERRDAILSTREERYPKGKSCGSIFKNIASGQQQELGLPHKSAGWLIDQCGLKGHGIGGAVIWEGNANWILNTGGARFEDIEALIFLARERVKERFGVEMELEVEIVR